MKTTTDEEPLLELVIDCTRQVAAEHDLPLPTAPDAGTPLMGEGTVFDSVGLVSLVLTVEETIQDRHGLPVSLADERALSEEHSPFRTLGSLASYAHRQLEDRRAGA